ncbi:helix-turn-helix domain-containing protein [Psychromonas ossibalaenae]|uniref:helix-turn-helix domain-containing protein n=1 Tax=Psychromonas ossibalaenae TaxID=444922 RepID=UPI00036ACCA5|nr:helix-turn-helix domain-containing protein [Psychromonas ossibalaenae]
MKNWIHSPKNPNVAKYVDCYWFIQKKHSGDSHQYPKLNPDPAAHLIIAPPEQSYQYEQAAMSASGKGSHWLFPHCQTFKMDHCRPFLILGIKFHIGALYSLNITPQQPVVDQVTDVDINALLNSELFSTAEILAKAELQPESCRDTLDELLMPWLLNRPQDKHSRLCRNALSLLADTPISNLGELLHCSQRTLERSFLRVTGLTLKQCQSMNKLEAMLESLYQKKDIDWLNVAYEFGFSDQPHLIRYLKSTIGSTPGEYAKQRDLVIDIYGDFEQN